MSTVETKPSLVLARRIAAAPEAVFAAWTQPAQLVKWFGPHGAQVLTAEVEARQHGRYRVLLQTPDGEKHDVSGIYRSFEPCKRLVFTWQWVTMPERQSLVTVELVPNYGATMLTLRHEQFADVSARDRHEAGWSGSLDKLQKLFA